MGHGIFDLRFVDISELAPNLTAFSAYIENNETVEVLKNLLPTLPPTVTALSLHSDEYSYLDEDSDLLSADWSAISTNLTTLSITNSLRSMYIPSRLINQCSQLKHLRVSSQPDSILPLLQAIPNNLEILILDHGEWFLTIRDLSKTRREEMSKVKGIDKLVLCTPKNGSDWEEEHHLPTMDDSYVTRWAHQRGTSIVVKTVSDLARIWEDRWY